MKYSKPRYNRLYAGELYDWNEDEIDELFSIIEEEKDTTISS